MYPFTLPQLSDHKGDLKKRWYIRFKAFDARTQEMRWFKDYIPSLPSGKQRYAAAAVLIRDLTLILQQTGGVIHGNNPKPMIPKPTRPDTFGDLMQLLQDRKLQSLTRKKSIESYEYVFRKFNGFIEARNWTSLEVDEFKAPHAMEFMNMLDVQKLSARSYNQMRTIMTGIFKDAIMAGYLESNPFQHVRTRKVRYEKNLPMPIALRDKIWNYLKNKDPQMWLFCSLVYYCFLRPSEILQLQVGHIRLAEKTIYLSGIQTKSPKFMAVSIPTPLMKILRQLPWEHYHDQDYLFSKGMKPGPDSRHYNAIHYKYKTYCKTLKVPAEFTLYSWKSTGVRDAVRAGVDIDQIQRHLRHSNLQTVQEYLKNIGAISTTELTDKFPEI